jgi:hypothetical protein
MDWESAMRDVAKNLFSMDWENFSPDTKFQSQVEELARQKYSQTVYNQRR